MYLKFRRRGVTLVEATAVMALLFPILMTVLFVLMEASQALVISENLDQGAKQAARNLAVAYATNPGITNPGNVFGGVPMYQYFGYDKVRISGVITDSSQFTSTGAGMSAPVWNLTSSPPTVTVTVRYLANGTTNLQKFPMFDPLKLGANYKLQSTATYRLE